MSKHLQLSISTPCHENWDNMTPVEKGRFCGSCQKQVVDFSKMSDREIAVFFKKPSSGSVCGRFMEDQLDRDIEIPKKRIPWVKYFFQFALPAFLISARATAQGKVKVKENSKQSEQVCTQTLGLIAPTIIEKRQTKGETIFSSSEIVRIQKKIINGKLVDETNKAIPFATVTIKGTANSTMADGRGYFTITSNKEWQEIIIIASALGYKRVEIPFEDKVFRGNKKFIIILKEDILFEKEVIVNIKCQFQKKNLGNEPIPLAEKKFNDTTVLPEVIIPALQGRVGLLTTKYVTEVKKDTIFQKIRKIIIDSFINNGLKIHPNPVNSGAMLNIEWKQSETGEYMLQLFNQAGQLTFNKAMWIDKDARVLNLEVPHVAAGNYFLE